MADRNNTDESSRGEAREAAERTHHALQEDEEWSTEDLTEQTRESLHEAEDDARRAGQDIKEALTDQDGNGEQGG